MPAELSTSSLSSGSANPVNLPTKLQVLGGMGLYFGIQLFLTPLLIFLYIVSFGQKEKMIEWGALCGLLLACLSLIFYTYILKTRKHVALWSLPNQTPFRSVWAFFYGVCFWPLSIVLIWMGVKVVHFIFPELSSLAIDQTAVKQLKESALHPYLFLGTLTSVMLLAPITEEILFRGLFQRMLRRKSTIWSAIMQTSSLFALLHCSSAQGLRNVEIFVALFILSCLMGYLYEKTEQLWAPIGLHMAFNSATVGALIYNSQLAFPL